ncbi:MAG: hypothetical protein A2509_03220 [Candidatus Edwardsbacteria bacterium RIFOXYD12_FULL_50_11]|uniref:Uncharacterized protein n=1 Tax=Candidatus Edwardsbacteria bacterium GWF2_54_11 TaxID=1817851 RepID=A0A1F5RHX7_9BACT|nr:MAG: hypothetical protein A2502_07080 [Candidatus Edwardsbacteria bacterium RifOxyC12_full_54_24]OGF14010.1 MAG: hypothetical protein A2024_05605 [Candidatus Edwardsbacteria bacterium GWF2_54_11]OGF16038.1 MAG: hypothetical protein A2509_03220 [Candidatus Edwardsbacteria bacterium RIFOXYD12_FULL_50_11]OGJ17586.1 MAG: hypothetical protein A2349_04235 [Candidatus Edwardsbacteria bacterium RifOxyB12_full_52_30]OGT06086.1 MAG: hypothetical protein A2X78_04970 [Gammaproteobacteria bacterium GWE2_
MQCKTKYIVTFLILGLLSNVSYGTFRTPYELREAKFNKKPKLDQWCTIKIKIVCEGEPTTDTLPLKINSPGIQTDLPGDKLPSWNDIKNGSVYRASFKIRPYFYGCSIMTISSVGGGVFIGINDKGKSSFAGTSAELNKKLGPWEKVVGYDIYGQPVHEPSERQERMQEKILSGYLNDGIKIISNKKGILKSVRGGGNILRYDFYLSPLPAWHKESKLKLTLVTRRCEQPKVEVFKRDDWKLYLVNDIQQDLKYLTNGIFATNFIIKPIKASGQHAWFKFVYDESDSTVRGLDLYFDEQGNLKPLE